MAKDLKKATEQALKDLHARESMRLGWYRQWIHEESLRNLRAQKANHQAFLKDLLRRRALSPAWYARLFYYLGHLFGFLTAYLPAKYVEKLEQVLEFWLLLRYKHYFKSLTLDKHLRSMIEAVQLEKLQHNEPGNDVLALLEKIIQEQEKEIVKL
ncbi:MAG: demethoxyubiquinone hydroxylase family protein [Bacteroidia bacterium]|nr:demethoxyubiquinone hydroxylase family protein [Bacteroidia bacterium]